jgi:serine/threonine protein kinase
MNATSRELRGGAFEETIHYEPNANSDPDGTRGADDMPNNTPRGQQRYAFGSGARPLEGYTIKRAIGRGGFGEVYYATSDAGKEVALKLITRNLDVERRGVQQCMNLKSPHLITVFDLKTNDAGDTFVVMEYVAGPSLASILAQHPKGLPAQQVRSWLKGLVEGVAYLHDHGIVHRDLKPANLFLEEGVVKIGDYGLSKTITHSQEPGHSESVGTCHYMAPEISSGKYHKPIDVYAIGVILYEMVTGRVPFDGESVGEVLMKHLTAQPNLSPLPEPYKAIVRQAMAKDPNHRPTRVHDLLPPEDAPKTPPVRFIGDNNSPPPAEPAKDDVLRIEAEEPVFYIGPDTVPPRQPGRRRHFAAWNPLQWGGCQVSRANYRRRAAVVPPRPVRREPPPPVVARRPTAPPAPAPPPEPPAQPSNRVRVAELASSMLWATPLSAFAAMLSLPFFPALNVSLPQDPLQLAFLFGLTLLGTWGLLVPSKLWEIRPVETWTKRFVHIMIGLALGAIGIILGQWTKLHPNPVWASHGLHSELASWAKPLGPASTVAIAGFASYFGLVFGANSWWKMTARDRWSRFRFLPVIKAGLIGGLLGAVWPSPQPWGMIVITLIAIVTQLASPWSRAAAEYAWATRKQKSKLA